MAVWRKRFWRVLAANVFLSILFVFSNFGIWNEINVSYRQSHWDAFWIQLSSVQVPGVPPVSGFMMILNWPFWLFWISTAVNLYFIVRVLREQ